MTLKPVKIKCPTGNENTQCYRWGKRRYIVSKLIEAAKDLEPFEIPLMGLNITALTDIHSMSDFVGHMKRVLEVDLSYPIILDDEGFIMDGRHRVAKALLEGRTTITAVRFDETPDWDFTVDE